ncbi:MAG: NAD-dependent deacylase [Deltaproteobacteria bacterium]|nr:NAD-dependent deacylase [Deltaproteobacteria bacterium]
MEQGDRHLDGNRLYREAAELLLASKRSVAFTGAGISVESGIPPFRGKDGLWSKYDPGFLEIGYFHRHPAESWALIREIFYDFFGQAKPNAAHHVLADLESASLLQAVVTQNIDNLHQEAGSRVVHEFHGTAQYLVCEGCSARIHVSKVDLNNLPPRCPTCNEVLKPDFVFFGEPIPESVRDASFEEAQRSDVFLVIGTTGEVMPASMVPFLAKQAGCRIIEVNVSRSNYTDQITDLFLQDRASAAMSRLAQEIEAMRSE